MDHTLSKEEILEKHRTWKQEGRIGVTTTNVYAAMDEHARNLSISFGVWLCYNWQHIPMFKPGGGWILQSEAMKNNNIEELEDKLIPIEKVFELFLTANQNKNHDNYPAKGQ